MSQHLTATLPAPATREITSLPPGPGRSLLNLVRFIRDPGRQMAALAARYGDPFTVHSVVGPMVITGRPAGVRALYAADPAILAVPRPELLAPLVGDSALILESGAPHRRDRKVMTPPFHGERMRAYGRAMREIALRHAAAWRPGEPCALLDTTQAIALDVIIRTIFGTTDPGRARLLHQAVVDLIAAFRPEIIFLPWLRRGLFGMGAWPRYQRAQDRLRQLTMAEIAARRSEPPGEDVLSLLLSARYEDGEALPDEWVRDQLGTLLFAGQETTAVALAWAIDHVHRDPVVLARLREELGGLGADPEPEAIAALPYLSAVCHETLRLHPGVPNLPGRMLRAPMSFLGYTLPAGICVTASGMLLHRDPAIYPQPDRFLPERFVGVTPQPTEFLAFGGGARRCIGSAFALYEMKIVLASLLVSRSFQLLDPQPDREVMRSLTLGPARGVRVRVS